MTSARPVGRRCHKKARDVLLPLHVRFATVTSLAVTPNVPFRMYLVVRAGLKWEQTRVRRRERKITIDEQRFAVLQRGRKFFGP